VELDQSCGVLLRKRGAEMRNGSGVEMGWYFRVEPDHSCGVLLRKCGMEAEWKWDGVSEWNRIRVAEYYCGNAEQKCGVGNRKRRQENGRIRVELDMADCGS
jgi:hypothetical protein